MFLAHAREKWNFCTQAKLVETKGKKQKKKNFSSLVLHSLDFDLERDSYQS